MIKKFKILQVIDFLNIGGAERVCITLSNLLCKSENKLSLLLLVNDGVLINTLDANVPIIRLNRKNKYNIRTMFRCAQIMKNYEIIHVHMRHNYRYIRLIQKLFFVKTTVILHDHFGSIDYDLSIPIGLKKVLKPKYYIGVSESLLNWATIQLKLPSNSTFLLSNIVAKEIIKEQVLQKKGLVMVGNIKPIKNQIFAIRLMKTIDNTLTIYGEIHDAKYFMKLQKVIKELEIENKIFFVHDSVNVQHDIQQYELGLQTSISESGPLVLIEFLAQSIPFLTYKTGQVVNDIKNDLPELILDDFEIDEWLNRFDRLTMFDVKLLEHVYKKYFSEKMYVTACEQIYESIINNEISE